MCVVLWDMRLVEVMVAEVWHAALITHKELTAEA